MKTCILAMPSYTYAIKSEKFLKSRGYSCEIKRNEDTSAAGCGYSLHINGSCDSVADSLKSYSIPFTVVQNGGE